MTCGSMRMRRLQSRLSAKASAQNAAAPPAIAMSAVLGSAPPAAEFDQQQAQATGQVRGEQEHESDLGGLDQRRPAPAQQGGERGLAAQRLGEHQKMHGQERGEQNPGQAVQDKRPVGRVAAVAPGRGDHRVTATIARPPGPPAPARRPRRTASALRPRQSSHSAATVRKPIGACTATASTKVA